MKDHLAELVRGSASPLQARNTVREYLQARILETLQRAGAMIPLAFHGGNRAALSLRHLSLFRAADKLVGTASDRRKLAHGNR